MRTVLGALLTITATLSPTPALAGGVESGNESRKEQGPSDVDLRVLGGRPAPAFEAVVALRDETGRLICSGTVIGRRAVLTAAHCVPMPEDGLPGPKDVCFGPRIDACTAAVAVTRFTTHAEWDRLTFHADLAVVELAGDAPAPALGLGADTFVPNGTALELLGYGRTDASASTSAGEKRSVTTFVTDLEDGRVVHGEAACNGDSGGPLFAGEGRVIAVTSSGPLGCRDFGRATLVAPASAWIAERISASEEEPDGGCTVGRAAGARSGSGAIVTIAAIAALLALAIRRPR